MLHLALTPYFFAMLISSACPDRAKKCGRLLCSAKYFFLQSFFTKCTIITLNDLTIMLKWLVIITLRFSISVTKGRIKHLMENNILSPTSIRLFILDEADKLMEKGSFEEQIKYASLKNIPIFFARKVTKID